MSDRYKNLEAYRDLVDRYFGDTVKGKANPYTSMSGNMYSFLDDIGRICLRMQEDDRARYAAALGTPPVKQYGATMKGYVAIPEDELSNEHLLQEMFDLCLQHARTLKKK